MTNIYGTRTPFLNLPKGDYEVNVKPPVPSTTEPGYQGGPLGTQEQWRIYYGGLAETEREKERQRLAALERQKRAELEAWMESQPQMYYNQYLSTSGMDEAQKSYFSNNFNKVYSDYQNKLIEQAKTGAEPSLKFGKEFLPTYNFGVKYHEQPYSQRGGLQTGIYTPRTRSFLNF